jgi:hypothetical protein
MMLFPRVVWRKDKGLSASEVMASVCATSS